MKTEESQDIVKNLEQSEINIFTALMVLLGLPFLGYFIISDLLTGRYLVALVSTPIFILIAAGMPAIRRITKNKDTQKSILNLFYYIFLITTGTLIIYLILAEGYSRAPWFYLFPLLSFLILGHRAGLVLTALFFLSLVGLNYFLPNSIPVFMPDIRTRFFISIILITVILYYLESWRYRYKNALTVALKDVKDSETRYRSLVNTMQEGLVGVDADWKITFVNNRFIEMSGYSHSELLEKSFFDLLSAESKGNAENELEKRRNRKTGMYELELVRSSGEKRNILCSPNPSYNSKGQYLGGFGVISDITDLKLSTQELHKSEERFKFLAENMGDVVWTLDKELKTTYVSPSVERILGFTQKERKTQKLEDMVTPDSLNRITKLLSEELEKEVLITTKAFAKSVLDSLTAHIAVLRNGGDIVVVNRAWQKFALRN